MIIVDVLLALIFSGILIVVLVAVACAAIGAVYRTAGLFWAACFAVLLIIGSAQAILKDHYSAKARIQQHLEEERRRRAEVGETEYIPKNLAPEKSDGIDWMDVLLGWTVWNQVKK